MSTNLFELMYNFCLFNITMISIYLFKPKWKYSKTLKYAQLCLKFRVCSKCFCACYIHDVRNTILWAYEIYKLVSLFSNVCQQCDTILRKQRLNMRTSSSFSRHENKKKTFYFDNFWTRTASKTKRRNNNYIQLHSNSMDL